MNRLFFSLNLASILSFLAIEAIDPFTEVGQFISMRGEHFPISPHGYVRYRIIYLSAVVVLSLCVFGVLGLRRLGTRAESFLRWAPGVVAIFGPLACWFWGWDYVQLPWPFTVLWTVGAVALSVALICFLSGFLGIGKKRLAAWLAVWFAMWIWLFWTRRDPVLIIIPIFGLLSAGAWFVHVVASRAGGAPANESSATSG